MATDDVHVWPVGDPIEHAVPRDDGSMGWVVIHHSLDGREFTEPDYQGPAMPREL